MALALSLVVGLWPCLIRMVGRNSQVLACLLRPNPKPAVDPQHNDDTTSKSKATLMNCRICCSYHLKLLGLVQGNLKFGH